MAHIPGKSDGGCGQKWNVEVNTTADASTVAAVTLSVLPVPCFTMQDLYYSENGKVGERRRVWASCMVDGFTDVAGGGSYRKKNGERMRFKVLHKVLDYKQRNGYHMCVGCGRCDDICPEYISFSNCINKLQNAMTEVSGS